jgi:NAD/NADP transhydrogenase alpha subunit
MNIMSLLALTVNEGAVVVDPEDEVLAGCAVVIDGVVRNQAALDALGGGS